MRRRKPDSMEVQQMKAQAEERDIQQRSEESADLLAGKSRVAEEGAKLLNEKATEAEQGISRFKLNNMESEEEKVDLERKTRETELLTERLVQESERRTAEADKLETELLFARHAEREAKEELPSFISRDAYTAAITPVFVSINASYSIRVTS